MVVFLLAVHIALVIFIFLVYTSSSDLGSPKAVYTRLLEASSGKRVCQEPITHSGQSCGPVSGNYQGTYATMLSTGGLVFGIINIVGNFGTVFVDNVNSPSLQLFCNSPNLFEEEEEETLILFLLLLLLLLVAQGYWISAIAARPSSTHKGYLLGGLVWFAVPFSLATSLGLGAVALDLPLTKFEADQGLVPPATAIALMGKGGSVLLLTMLFM